MKISEEIDNEEDSDEILFLVDNKWQNSFEIVEQRSEVDRRSHADRDDNRKQKGKQAGTRE